MHVSRKAGLRFGSPALNPEERDVVQVGLAGAVSSKDKKFRTMHEGCGGTIKEPKTCSKCEKTVEQEDLVSGYEYAKDEFIVFTRPELDALDVEKTPFIDVTKFVLYEELDLTMLASQYYLVPDKVVPGRYGVLYQVLTTMRAAGIGSTTIWGKEHPIAVYPHGGVLMLATLNLHEDLVEPDFTAPVPSKAALAEFKPRVLALMGHLDPEDLESESRRRKNDLIAARSDGPTTDPPNLVEELKKTVKARRPKAKAKA
jgi:DNA end-binding protein Ku